MITTSAEITNNFGNTVVKIWQVELEPSIRILREHRHINFEIMLVIDGSGIYHTVSGDKFMKQGDVFVFPSNTPHCITQSGENGLKILNLHFTKQFALSLGLTKTYPNLFYNSSDKFSNHIPTERSEIIKEYILKIHKELEQKEKEYQYVISTYLEMIFIELIRNHDYLKQDEAFTDSLVSKILRSIEYIDKNFDCEITLNDIARESGFSPNYFSNLFAKYFNIKLWDYITSKRIEKAKKLLRENSKSETMLEIALNCGFNSTANFNRAFKLHTGLTPSEYIKGCTFMLH